MSLNQVLIYGLMEQMNNLTNGNIFPYVVTRKNVSMTQLFNSVLQNLVELVLQVFVKRFSHLGTQPFSESPTLIR